MAAAKSARIGTDLTQGKIGRTLITFALPLIATNLIQQLYSAVDLAVIGQFTDKIGTVQVAQGSDVSDLVAPLAMAFGTAGQTYIAQLTGAGDRTKTRHTVGTLLSWMILLSFVFMAGTLALRWKIMGWLNCPPEALEGAVQYLEITAIAMPAVFIYNGICSNTTIITNFNVTNYFGPSTNIAIITNCWITNILTAFSSNVANSNILEYYSILTNFGLIGNIDIT